MKFLLSDDERLKRALRKAHYAKEWEDVGDRWQSQVMRRVRSIGPLKSGMPFWSDLEYLVWRLAPVSCLLIASLSVLFLNMDFDFGNDLLGTLRAELEEPSLSEFFGFEG